jgi:ligand-binding SRPBCC domain-containing protein
MTIRDCHILRCELVTETPLAETFRVFENPYNLAKITPPWLNFRIVTENLKMRRGALIDYRIGWLGLPMKWRTLITEYDPPLSFVDEQLKGPYVLWRHRHTFLETAEGTVVGDEVRYILPMGPLGRVAHAVMVRRQLEGIFRYRQKALGAMLGRIVRVSDPEFSRGRVDVTRPEFRGGTASPGVRRPEASY